METKIDLSFYPLNKSYSKVEIGNFRQSNHGDVSDKVRRKMFILHAFLTSATSFRITLHFFFWASNLSLWFLSFWKNNKMSCLQKVRQNFFLFCRKEDTSMGQVLGTELGNNTFSNSLGLDDPNNSPNVFSPHI